MDWLGLLGSALMGVLYDFSLTGLVLFSVVTQGLGAAILLALVSRRQAEVG